MFLHACACGTIELDDCTVHSYVAAISMCTSKIRLHRKGIERRAGVHLMLTSPQFFECLTMRVTPCVNQQRCMASVNVVAPVFFGASTSCRLQLDGCTVPQACSTFVLFALRHLCKDPYTHLPLHRICVVARAFVLLCQPSLVGFCSKCTWLWHVRIV